MHAINNESLATIVLGAQWGDEGKGKIVDLLATKANVVCRFNGGGNAGHTVVANGVEYDFHILPSGVINDQCISIIGNGCVVNIPDLIREVYKNELKGLKGLTERLLISNRAHLVFDFHKRVDALLDVSRGAATLGTTNMGIGPTYASKVTRNGIRMCDLFDDFVGFAEKFRALVQAANTAVGLFVCFFF